MFAILASMKQNIHTQTNETITVDELDMSRIDEEQSFIVVNDGVVDEALTVVVEKVIEPNIAVKLIEALHAAISSVVGKVSAYILKQARMALYDALHGTHYRKLHNQMQRELREDQYLQRTGVYDLVRRTSHLAK